MILIPEVLHKDKKEPFDRTKITESLIKETELDRKIAEQIAKEVHAFIISNNLKIVTGPLLREISNVFLLSHNLEIHRLKNTRIGLPYYDLQSVLLYDEKIIEHIEQEYYAVRKLIGECEQK